jgi:hypothetical protein
MALRPGSPIGASDLFKKMGPRKKTLTPDIFFFPFFPRETLRTCLEDLAAFRYSLHFDLYLNTTRKLKLHQGVDGL